MIKMSLYLKISELFYAIKFVEFIFDFNYNIVYSNQLNLI